MHRALPSISPLIVLAAASLLSAPATNALPPAAAAPSLIRTAEDPEEARDALLDGVAEIAGPGSPGDVVAFGPDAFAVVCGAGGAPVVAATPFGRGRAMIFGHGGYVTAGALDAADQAAFTRNALRWLSGGKRKPTVACPGKKDLADKLVDLGFKAGIDIPLKDAHVVVAPEKDFTPEEIQTYVDFVERGGGLMTGITGWGWQQLNPKKVLSRDFGVQRLAARFGIASGLATVGKTGAVGYLTAPRPDAWSSAGRSYRALRDGVVPTDARPRAIARVRAWLNAMPDHEPMLGLELREWLAGDADSPQELRDAYAKRDWRPLAYRLDPWRVIGPFRGGRRVSDEQAAEKLLEDLILDGPGPDYERELRGLAGRVAWRGVPKAGDGGAVDAGIVRFEQLLTAPPKKPEWTKGACAYAHRAIHANEPIDLPLRLGAADGVRLWLNGELVVDADDGEGVEGSTDVVLRLQPGRNHVLLKVRNDEGSWGFRLRDRTTLSQDAVNAAVDRGVAWLLERQLIDGTWPDEKKYGVGFTAYVLYALLKSGVDPEHAAVRRALAYVESHHGEYTYATACRALALAALDRGDSLDTLRDSVDQLVAWQEGDGLYAYPVYPTGGRPPQDLSNTLYAALALRAAEKRGVPVPRRTWEGIVEGTLRCWTAGNASRKRGGAEAAGFSYRAGGNATGSMTTAGLSLLAMGREALGDDIDKRLAKEVDEAIASGVEWTARRLVWTENPGQDRWQYFFLYGVERVGALLKLDVIGKVDWYGSGAEYLVGAQAKDGEWHGKGAGAGTDTILALLFLNKATAPISGRAKISDRQVLTANGPVSIQAIGKDPVVAWITGFGEEERARLGDLPRVERVEWIVRDPAAAERVAATVAGDPEAETLQRYEARVEFGEPGTYELFARVHTQEPAAEAGLQPRAVTLVSPPVQVEISAGASAPFVDYAHDGMNNLMKGAKAEASTTAGNNKPENAVDGKHGTRWAFQNADAKPWFRAKLTPARPANRLLLTHGWPYPKEAGRAQVAELEVIVNGEERFQLTTVDDPHAKTVLELPANTRVATIELRVKTLRRGELGSANAGFSEIELLP